MLNLSVFSEHSLDNSDFIKKALIIDGDRPYIRRSEVGMRKSEDRRQRTEVGGQMTEDRCQKTENG